MNIRKSNMADVEEILRVFAYAREQMRLNGNPNQWVDNYPSREVVEKDITDGNSYVLEEDGHICGTFAFILGADPTYSVIENGQWLNDESYGTIHRIASNGRAKGVFNQCLEFCQRHISNIRIDTHEDNLLMQHLIEKNGFQRCGIIYIKNGSPRIAYQRQGELIPPHKSQSI